jgi:hypothetical protein
VADRGRAEVEWVPASAAQLGERRRLVRTSDGVDIGLETIVFGAAIVLVPVIALFGSPAPLAGRLLVGAAFEALFVFAFVFSQQGLYLSRTGVTVWNLSPRPVIPWAEVGEFRLERKKIRFGDEFEVVTVVTKAGSDLTVWDLKRAVGFESGPLVKSAKAELRSFPVLVDQLNRIARDAVDAPPASL